MSIPPPNSENVSLKLSPKITDGDECKIFQISRGSYHPRRRIGYKNFLKPKKQKNENPSPILSGTTSNCTSPEKILTGVLKEAAERKQKLEEQENITKINKIYEEMEMSKNDSHKIMKLLAQLKCINMTSNLLKATNIEKKLKQLVVKKCEKFNPTMKIMIVKWKEQTKKQQKSKDKKETECKSEELKERIDRNKTKNEQTCEENKDLTLNDPIAEVDEVDSKSSISNKIVMFLCKCFVDYCNVNESFYSKNNSEEKAMSLSKSIESFIKSQYEVGSQKYSTKARTILANLKRNKALIGELLEDKISIAELFKMDICEMADSDVKNKRKEHQDNEKEKYALRGNSLA